MGARHGGLAPVAGAAALAILLALGACGAGENTSTVVHGASPARGRELVARYGCGACHVVPGVRGAEGMLGPPLTAWSRRDIVAGVLPNAPPDLVRWIMTPQAIVPGNAMPDMGVTAQDAEDIAAYLYTIR